MNLVVSLKDDSGTRNYMGIMDKINEALEEAAREDQQKPVVTVPKPANSQYGGSYGSLPNQPRVKRKKTGSTWGVKKSDVASVVVVGYPVVWPSIDWNEVGLGLVRILGYVPNKAVKLEFKEGMLHLTGARANSFVVYFLAASGFGLIYFMQDLLTYVKDWGSILSGLIVVVPILINVFIRTQTIKFKPYEIEMLGYDSVNSTLVLSIMTEPGGAVAIKLDLPMDRELRKLEEKRILTSLRTAYAGLTFIDGLAVPDRNRFRQTMGWWFVSLFLFALARYFG